MEIEIGKIEDEKSYQLNLRKRLYLIEEIKSKERSIKIKESVLLRFEPLDKEFEKRINFLNEEKKKLENCITKKIFDFIRKLKIFFGFSAIRKNYIEMEIILIDSKILYENYLRNESNIEKSKIEAKLECLKGEKERYKKALNEVNFLIEKKIKSNIVFDIVLTDDFNTSIAKRQNEVAVLKKKIEERKEKLEEFRKKILLDELKLTDDLKNKIIDFICS